MRKIFLLLCLLFSSLALSQEDPLYTLTTAQSVPLEQINLTGGTALNLGDDSSVYVPLGFDFTFYGNVYNYVWVSSNGFISFTEPSNGCCNGYPLPTWYNNTIFAMWEDLISWSSPYIQTLGIGEEQRFVVGWYNTSEYGTQNALNFEITLFETSNDFMINYGQIPNTTYHTVTSGVQGPNGEYTTIFYGQNTSSLSNTAYLFSATPTTTTVDCSVDVTNIECITNSTIDPIVESIPIVEEQPVDIFVAAAEQAAVLEEQVAAVASPAETQTAAPETSTQQTTTAETTTAAASASEEKSTTTTQTSSVSLSLILSIVSETSIASTSSTSQQTTVDGKVENADQSVVDGSVTVDDQTAIVAQDALQASVESASQQAETLAGETEKKFADSETSQLIVEMMTPTMAISGVGVSNDASSTTSIVTLDVANTLLADNGNNNESSSNSDKNAEEDNEMAKGQTEQLESMNSTNLNSYTNTMLVDLAVWYKPDDIYRNNKIDDNVRGIYFMQKGTSDLFNKMVEDQYKR